MEVNKIKNSLSKNNLRDSYNRASSYFVKTPIIKANFLSAYLDTNIYLKLEDQQKTSAFKFRGAINALLPLKSSGNEKTVVCSSSGSHAMGMCQAGKELGINVIVFLPNITPEYKVQKIKKLGGDIKFFGEFLVEAQAEAERYANDKNLSYISPYNHPATIQGNGGFIAWEIMDSEINFSKIICPIGGGGLIAGLATALAINGCVSNVIGVESEANPSMKNAISNNDVNFPLDPKESIAEALNCSVSYTGFLLIQEYVKDICLVPELTIKEAMKILLKKEKLLTEGSGAISTAHLLKNINDIEKENYLLLVTGANIKKSSIINL